jgi:putative spermidine/putrescine transport system permease protein
MHDVARQERSAIRKAVKQAERPSQRRAFLLAVPLLAFLILAFVMPIALLLFTSVTNPETKSVIPNTVALLQSWDGKAAPGEEIYAALADELRTAQANRTAAMLGKRLNYEMPGMRSRVVATARAVTTDPHAPYREKFIALDPAWGDPALWQVIKRNGSSLTPYYLMTAVDLEKTPDGAIQKVKGDQAIFIGILGRTLFIAALVTLATLLLGYPVAYVLTIAPAAVASIMMLMVLLPLWTSLLVRTTAWVVLLQSDGVINNILMGLGLIAQKAQLIFTRLGTVIAMTHIQLPFTILPIYSVMRSIPPTHLRAARSLGASPFSAFWRVYAPQTLPGVVAGSLITFILSLGYYITPALVGGPGDQMVSNFISFFINRDLNWGLASALGVVLLTVTLSIYFLFLRLVGADKLKLG